MRASPRHLYTLTILPCPSDARVFRWIIHARDGALVARSPYAFTTADCALISGTCWMHELTERVA